MKRKAYKQAVQDRRGYDAHVSRWYDHCREWLWHTAHVYDHLDWEDYLQFGALEPIEKDDIIKSLGAR